MSINYGLDRVPSPAGWRRVPRQRQRCPVEEVDGGAQISVAVTIEVKGESRPALAATCIYRYYD
jgi:hypothetical protein